MLMIGVQTCLYLSSFFDNNSNYPHRWSKGLSIGGSGLDPAHHIHALYDLSKGGKSLAIGIALATKIKRRLVAYTYKELGAP